MHTLFWQFIKCLHITFEFGRILLNLLFLRINSRKFVSLYFVFYILKNDEFCTFQIIKYKY